MQPILNGKVSEREDNYTGFYLGTVTKQCDECGACKVFVHGVYPDDFKNDPERLPTAYPCMPLWGGGRSENKDFPNGIYQYPDLNTTVLVFFASNDINKPYFLAMMDHDKGKYDHDSISIHYGECYIQLKKGGDMKIFANHDIDIEATHDINVKCGHDMTMTVGNNRTSKITNTDYTKTKTLGASADEGMTFSAPYMKLLTEDGFFGTIEGKGRVAVLPGSVPSGEGICYIGPYIKVMKLGK